MGAGLSRHDDVERMSPLLRTVAVMHLLGASIVSHHRCASTGFSCHRGDASVYRSTHVTTEMAHGEGHTERGRNHDEPALGSRLGLSVLHVAMARPAPALGALGVLCWLEPTRVLKGLIKILNPTFIYKC